MQKMFEGSNMKADDIKENPQAMIQILHGLEK